MYIPSPRLSHPFLGWLSAIKRRVDIYQLTTHFGHTTTCTILQCSTAVCSFGIGCELAPLRLNCCPHLSLFPFISHFRRTTMAQSDGGDDSGRNTTTTTIPIAIATTTTTVAAAAAAAATTTHERQLRQLRLRTRFLASRRIPSDYRPQAH